MTTAAMKTTTTTALRAPTRPADHRPALVYLARLSHPSRRTMAGALRDIAHLISDGRCDAETLDWAALKYQHTAAIRTALQETISVKTGRPLSVATVNKLPAVLTVDIGAEIREFSTTTARGGTELRYE